MTAQLYCYCYYYYLSTGIDTIEIRSDEEEGSGATKTRRTYNYRVCEVTHCIGRSVMYFTANKVLDFANISYLVFMVERKDPEKGVEKLCCCWLDMQLPTQTLLRKTFFLPVFTALACKSVFFLVAQVQVRVIFVFLSLSFCGPLDSEEY